MQVVVIIMLGLLVVTAARIEGSIARIIALAVEADVGSATFTTTINGVTYTRTYVQQQGESDADFEVRALRLWNEYLARITGG